VPDVGGDSTNDTREEQGGRSSLWLAGIAVVVILPPAGAIAAIGLETAQQNPLLAILGTLAYEAIVATLTIVGSILSALRDRWTQRLIESVDSHLIRLTSRYTSAYLRYIKASNSFIDLRGLTTRGEFTLSLTEIFYL
jgi:hypothetical protein